MDIGRRKIVRNFTNQNQCVLAVSQILTIPEKKAEKKYKAAFFITFLIVLFLTNIAFAIKNPSFEDNTVSTTPTGLTYPMPNDWSWRAKGKVNGFSYEYWASDGQYSLYLYCQRFNTHYVGDYTEFYQKVDLTDTLGIKFDVLLSGNYLFSRPYVSIDGNKLWKKTGNETRLGETIDTSSYTGVHEIRFGLEVLHAFSYPAYEWADGHTNFDNLRFASHDPCECTPPPQPANPDPCDGALDVSLDVNLSWGEVCTAECNLPNSGFESGGFSPWITVAGSGEQLNKWAVTNKTLSQYFTSTPFEGIYYAQNGFDGSAEMFYDIYQEKTIPECVTSLILKWSERIQWDMVTYHRNPTLPRTYAVSIQPAGGGAPLAVLYSMDLEPNTKGDTGYVSHSIDLLSKIPGIAGQTIRIDFHEYIPEEFTGPAQFDLDGISLTCNGITATNDVWMMPTQPPKEESTPVNKGYPGIRMAVAEVLPRETENYNDERSVATDDIQINPIAPRIVTALAAPGQIVNGNFETGSLSGWTLMNSTTAGTFVINNGTYKPGGPDVVLPPYSGNYSALTTQTGAGIRRIYQDVTLPADANSATLKWADRIRNHATAFADPTQEFRVEILNTNNNVLASLFSTNPGDPLIREWTERSANISQFAGMTIRVAFTEEGHNGYFNVHLDNIRIEPGDNPPPPSITMVYDVYLGTDPNSLELISEDISKPLCDPTPDANGALNDNTTYYWQVIAKNDCNQTEGPVWSFKTVKVNKPPIANAGLNQTVYAWIDGKADVKLDGSGSYDPDGDALTYLWKWSVDGNDCETNGCNSTIKLPAGQYTLELVVNDGSENSEPNQVVITVVEPIKSALWVVPRIINMRSEQPHIMTMLRLPAGITKEQIDPEQKLLLYPGGIESSFQRVLSGVHGGVEQCFILARFDKSELIDAVGKLGKVQLDVVDHLKTGQCFFGSDTICIINPPLIRQPNMGVNLSF